MITLSKALGEHMTRLIVMASSEDTVAAPVTDSLIISQYL